MKYLLGSEKVFYNFVDSISKKDKVGIVTHTDVDGLISGLFLNKILESKGLKPNFIEFLNYGSGVLKEFSERKSFDYLFFSDWNLDHYSDDLKLLREKGKVLVIDHHPINEELKDKSGIIKTESKICSAHCLFNLAKYYLDTKDLEWLVCSAIIMDYCFTVDKNFNFIKSIYPKITLEKIWDSEPALIGKKIDNSIIYYKPNIKKVYDLVLKKDLKSLDKANKIIEKEILETEKRYLKEADYFPKKNLFFGFINSKHGMVSAIISRISNENPDKIFLMAGDLEGKKDFIKASARNQAGNIDLGGVLKKCVEDFKDSSAGGHIQAASCTFPKKYLNEFKKRLLKEFLVIPIH